jgi:hypothetical protein
MGDWMRSVISEVLRELFVFDRTLPCCVRSFFDRSVRSWHYKARERKPLGRQRLGSLKGMCGSLLCTRRWHQMHLVATSDAFGRFDLSVRSLCFFPSEGVTTILALGATNRRGTQAWLRLSTSGDFVSMLESAWEPSNSLVLARLQINSE